MNSKKVVFSIAAALTFSLSCIQMNVTAAEEPVPIPDDGELFIEPYGKLVIDSLPYKTNYKTGEELDLSGLKVSLSYEVNEKNWIYKEVSPLDYPEIFVVDTDFDSSRTGEFTVSVKCTEEAEGLYWVNNYDHNFTVSVQDDGDLLYDAVMYDWIPRSFSEAMRFENQYGATHIENGLICTLQRIAHSERMQWKYETVLKDNSMECEEFSFRLAYEKPSEDDPNYEQIMSDLGIRSIPEEYIIKPDWEYEIKLYMPVKTGNLEIEQIITNAENDNVDKMNYSFKCDKNGSISETDIYRWLPDCYEETCEYIKKHGEVSVCNDGDDHYIVFCGNICRDGGYDLFVDQSGETEAEEVYRKDLKKKNLMIPPPGGNAENTVILYKPKGQGNFQMSFIMAHYWDKTDIGSQEDKNYSVLWTGAIVESGLECGDCNLDGEFNIKDLVMLKKYILNAEDTDNNINLPKADFTGNGVVDIFDYCMMRKALLDKQDTVTPPAERPLPTYSTYEDYEKYLTENNLYDKISTYDDIKNIGKFTHFVELEKAPEDDFPFMYMYGLDDGIDYPLYIRVEKMGYVDYCPMMLVEESEINPSDMRTTKNPDVSGGYTVNGISYIYSNGKLNYIEWANEEKECYYSLSGSSMLYDYPIEADTFAAKLLKSEIKTVKEIEEFLNK